MITVLFTIAILLLIANFILFFFLKMSVYFMAYQLQCDSNEIMIKIVEFIKLYYSNKGNDA